MSETVIRKIHKRTVVEEVDEEPEYPVNVSYMSNAHAVSPASTAGMLVVNFLIHTRSPITTNVVCYGKSGNFSSMYNLDLSKSLASLGITDRVILGRSGFENEADTVQSVSSLAEYLMVQDGNRMPHEDRELLNSAQDYLARRRPVPRPERSNRIRVDQGIVRDSITSSVPVRSPRSRPMRDVRVITEESSDEEVMEDPRSYPRR